MTLVLIGPPDLDTEKIANFPSNTPTPLDEQTHKSPVEVLNSHNTSLFVRWSDYRLSRSCFSQGKQLYCTTNLSPSQHLTRRKANSEWPALLPQTQPVDSLLPLAFLLHLRLWLSLLVVMSLWECWHQRSVCLVGR
jgi:hypothetical protein